jgi:hypothetical protein
LFTWLNQVEADPDLPASTFKVAYRIGQSFNKDTLWGFPGLEYIASKTVQRKQTVLEAVKHLVAKGHIEVRKGSPGRGRSNHYRPLLKGTETVPFAGTEKVENCDLSEPPQQGMEKVRKPDLFALPQNRYLNTEKVRFTENKYGNRTRTTSRTM